MVCDFKIFMSYIRQTTLSESDNFFDGLSNSHFEMSSVSRAVLDCDYQVTSTHHKIISFGQIFKLDNEQNSQLNQRHVNAKVLLNITCYYSSI